MSEKTEHQPPPGLEFVIEAFQSWPLQTKIGITLFAVTWLVGGNILMYYSYKRRGISFWKSMIPTPSSFRSTFDLNAKEWLILLLLAIASFSFAIWGMAGSEV